MAVESPDPQNTGYTIIRKRYFPSQRPIVFTSRLTSGSIETISLLIFPVIFLPLTLHRAALPPGACSECHNTYNSNFHSKWCLLRKPHFVARAPCRLPCFDSLPFNSRLRSVAQTARIGLSAACPQVHYNSSDQLRGAHVDNRPFTSGTRCSSQK